MAWFRRPRRLNLGRFVEPEPLPESSIDDLVAESELLVGAAVRLAVKNLLILSSVRDGLDYDEERYVAAARAELLVLADEKRADADRAGEARAHVQGRAGRAQHFHDYHSIDSHKLARREAYDRQLAVRLRELAEDDYYLVGLADAARDAAWHEIADSVRAKLARQVVSADERDYLVDRGWKLEELANDLARQVRDHEASRPPGPPADPA